MSWRQRFTIVAAGLLVLTGCSTSTLKAKLAVQPATSRFDEPVSVEFIGLPSGVPVTVTARLSAHHITYPRTALQYPDAGNQVGGMNVFLNLATTRGEGGTVNTNAMAADAGYSRLLTWPGSR